MALECWNRNLDDKTRRRFRAEYAIIFQYEYVIIREYPRESAYESY